MGTLSAGLVVFGAVVVAGYGRLRRHRRRNLALRRLREASPIAW
ncbi:MAG TPA: hypothetical protein VFQ38_12225 [Longimicrobiales bacterium]|nr:hypothetical protein [Longimicrobiales bacterium]